MLEIPHSFWLDKEDTPFPETNLALQYPNGLIAIGADLSSDRLLSAYSRGIFPWYKQNGKIFWYCPDPRMIITPESFHLSKSTLKLIRVNNFTVKKNKNFDKVIKICSNIPRKEQAGTWIDDDMVKAYSKLNQQGYVHSYEVYDKNDILVGGLYGVALGRVFFGESMFSLVSNASKIALHHLIQSKDYSLIDCQVESEHLKTIGGYNISRELFIEKIQSFM